MTKNQLTIVEKNALIKPLLHKKYSILDNC